MKNIDVNYFVFEQKVITEKLISIIHKLNKKIFVWTVNEPDKIEKYLAMGLDGVITDYPNKAKKLKQ